MDKPGYTPGPWSVRRAKTPSDGGYDYGIAAVINGGEVCIAEAFEVVRIKDRAPAEANARLIAAAPELVSEGAALVHHLGAIIYYLDGQAYSSTLSQMNAFKAVLSKALGEGQDSNG